MAFLKLTIYILLHMQFQLSPWHLFPKLFTLPEIHGSNPTKAIETIRLFIMHGCVFIHQIWSSPIPLRDRMGGA